MQLQHIDLKDLKIDKSNVRKIGAKDVSDLVPSIRSLGIIQPLLVRPNCKGFDIIAGQRRFHATSLIAEEAQANEVELVPCIVMDKGDDAKAIEASLAENVARLPMDQIDQYKAFAALVKEGKTVEEIATDFGITERLIHQRLALANLYQPILTAFRKDEISAGTIRVLTLATKRQQQNWWVRFKSESEHAPEGHALKSWLFGGSAIPTCNALFDVSKYDGSVVADLFGEESYFSDTEQFWSLQNTAIAKAKENYLTDGWQDVTLLEVGKYWSSWEYAKASKKNGGRVYVSIASDGEVQFHEGYITQNEAQKRQKAKETGKQEKPALKAELTKAMQNNLDLHRHAAVRLELLSESAVALRLGVAQMIAGSSLWSVQADPQKANSDAIKESLSTNKANDDFSAERQRIRKALAMGNTVKGTLVPRKEDWDTSHDLYAIFGKLTKLDDAEVAKILTFVVAETLPSGSPMVEVLGNMLSVDMTKYWKPDQVFFDLLKDKEAINAMVEESAGKNSAEAHISSTAKVQKQIVQNCLNGTRKSGKKSWQPRYMRFPMEAYTKRGGVRAIDNLKQVKKHFKRAS